MRKEDEEDEEVTSELSDEKLLEVLRLVNDRLDTNFNIREVEEDIPLAELRNCTIFQLESRLMRFCRLKAFESVDDDTEDESSQLTDGDDVKVIISKPDKDTVKTASRHCNYCQRTFQTVGHLRQHMVIHTPGHLTCSICGLVLKNPSSRRLHEKKHRETDTEREERLQKARDTREQAQAGRKVVKRKARGRVSQV